MKKQLIIITGPTGVGKTLFVDRLSSECAIEIINGDVGQMYSPLSIGTAQPNWKVAEVLHHLFGVLSEPVNFTVTQYRQRIADLLLEIWDRDMQPVIVGGSGFYLLSLFFPPRAEQAVSLPKQKSPKELWSELDKIDPKRAKQIDEHDSYRLQRALAIWQQTQKKPSEYRPFFDPIASNVTIVWIDRDREDLYHRIDERVLTMIQEGWQKEIEALVDTPWEPFLHTKKLIGYNEFFHYLNGETDKDQLIATIQRKSRNYAKRQKTFWRSFKEKISMAVSQQQHATEKKRVVMDELNLTHADIDRYIKQLKRKICP